MAIRTSLLVRLILSAILFAGWGRGDESANRKQDEEQMRKIHAAIFGYVKAKGDLPGRLLDLVPDQLEDRSLLVSPAEKPDEVSDENENWRKRLQTSYSYEFGYFADEKHGISQRTVRLKQMDRYGTLVPILRCRLYGKTLNLTFGGEFFESDEDWENSAEFKKLLLRDGRGEGKEPIATFTLQCVGGDDVPLKNVRALIRKRIFQSILLPEIIVFTDEKGEAQIPLGPDGTCSGRVEAAKFGYLVKSLEWDTAAAGPDEELKLYRVGKGDRLKLSFDAAAMIGGEVRNAKGDLLVGAKVDVYAYVRKDRDDWMEKLISTEETDVLGQWVCRTLPGEAKDLSFSISSPKNFTLDQFLASDESSMAFRKSLSEGTAQFVLQDPIPVKIQSTEASLEMKSYMAFMPDEDLNRRCTLQQWTSETAQGVINTTLRDRGDLWVLLMAEGKAPMLQKLRMIGKPMQVPITMETGREVRGKIVDPTDTPLAGVKIVLKSMGRVVPAESPVVAESDANGNFVWNHAPTNFPVMLEASGTPIRLEERDQDLQIKVRQAPATKKAK